MSVRVSVVVPVFNPGPTFDELIESLDQQTIETSAFEVILCDDGSDQATQERLATIARARTNVRVLTLPHSGWPGTPRNHGIAEAAGKYVQFVDQDDRLFESALEKLCDYADLHSSDVVIGKEVGVGRALPRRIFRRDIPRAILGKDPILELLTPHKMFRTAFLRDNDIHFPNGRVRLEDHLFVMEAYFAADTISVLASVPCYAWIKHPGSASSSRIDPVTYFPHLESVLDLVEAHTEPGRLRDRLLRHWFRGKILKRLSGRQMLRYPDEYRDGFIDVVRPLAERRFGPGVDAGLAFPHRIRAALLRADRRADLLRFAKFENELEASAEVSSARWTRGGGLQLRIRVRVLHAGQEALRFAVSDATRPVSTWVPPTWLADLPAAALDASRDVRDDQIELLARTDAVQAERRLFRRASAGVDVIEVAVDPLKVFRSENAARRATLRLRVRRAGWTFDIPVTADPAVLVRAGRSPLLAGRDCTLMVDEGGVVELRRDGAAGGMKDLVGRAVRRVRAARRRS